METILLILGGVIIIGFFISATGKKNKKSRSAQSTPPAATKTKSNPDRELFPEDFLRFKQNKIPPEFKKPKADVEDTSSFFHGKKVCISGSLDSFPYRAELAEHLWNKGADINTSVSKVCDVLISGRGVGPSKLKTAQEHGVYIMTEEDLTDKLNGFKSRFV